MELFPTIHTNFWDAVIAVPFVMIVTQIIRNAQASVQLRTNWRTFDEIKETRRSLEKLKGLEQMRQA